MIIDNDADDYMPQAVRAAYEVVDLWRENERLRRRIADLEEYEQRYNKLLDDSVKHGEQMMAGWVGLLLSDKVRITP